MIQRSPFAQKILCVSWAYYQLGQKEIRVLTSSQPHQPQACFNSWPLEKNNVTKGRSSKNVLINVTLSTGFKSKPTLQTLPASLKDATNF